MLLHAVQVDVHLGRFDKALGHLMAADPPRFEDALRLAHDKVMPCGDRSLAALVCCVFLSHMLTLRTRAFIHLCCTTAEEPCFWILTACLRHRPCACRILQGLLRELLALCGDNEAWRRAVLLALGDALSLRSLHEDAAVAFVAADELEKALLAYRAGGAFQMALALAGVQIISSPSCTYERPKD